MSESTDTGRVTAVPAATIEAFSRTIYKEASSYGFGQVDVIKLINELMDLCTSDVAKDIGASSPEEPLAALDPSGFTSLPIHGPRISIRDFDVETDKHLLETWLPDRYGRYFVLSCATAQEITVDSLSSAKNNRLGIILSEDGTPIGAMAYLDHSKKQKRAELRKLIGDPESRGKGYAEEATRLWLRFGVHGLGLRKIYVSTLQTQIANIKLNESIGFQVEGLLKNEVLIDDQRHDVLRMGLSVD